MKQNSGARWALDHGMHTCGAKDPFDYYLWARNFHLRDISSKISQDSLIMAGARDHLVPVAQIWSQGAALTNARSVTARVFTEYERAAEHCQSTNPKPALVQILSWLSDLERRDHDVAL
jgi:pimeloyl-ACP methyl ester carboxylesterase